MTQRSVDEASGDLKARWMLINMAEFAYRTGEKSASATLIHAERYLADRADCEADPWPKGLVQMPYVIKEPKV